MVVQCRWMATTFDQLTRTLSAGERADLLKRVQGLGLLAEEAAEDAPAEVPGASEIELVHLGLLTKIWLILVAFFTGKTRGDVLRDLAMRRLADQILSTCPGLLDQRRGVLLRKSRDEIDELGQASGRFREALRKALGEDQDVFVAFLTGHLLPHVQERFSGILDLDSRASELDPLELSVIRRRLSEDLETAFDAIPEHERRGVYADIQALHRLRGLTLVPFSEILETFDTDAVPGECAFLKVRKTLSSLDTQLQSARRPPSAAALEGLYLFSHGDELGPDFPLEERLTQELGEATEALTTIRAVARRVPFTRMVRLVTGNLDYTPRSVGGGEDWFVLFKRYWMGRAEEALRELGRSRERDKLREEAEAYLGVHRLPRIGTDGMTGVALQVVQEHELSLSLVLGFYHEVFFKVARSLGILLEKAHFVKEDNRRELGQACAFLNTLDERLDLLNASLRSEAELMADPPDGEARRALAQRAGKLVQGFLDDCELNIKMLINVVEGILRGSPGNRYDTVFNLDTVGDWQGRLMSEVLDEAYERAGEGLSLLSRIRSF